jgi:hypothetical protein
MQSDSTIVRFIGGAFLGVLVVGCGDDQAKHNPFGADEGIGDTGLFGEDGAEASSGDAEGGGGAPGEAPDGPAADDGDDGDDDGEDDGEDDGGAVKWDILEIPDAGHTHCGFGSDFAYSYLWAANSAQGTLSKIDTKTVTERGRYIVRPDGAGSPSRTSVSLSGHVAVANRNGGITKIWADPSFCEDTNGIPGIQTSEGPAFLPWGQDECIAWYRPMNYNSQRPIAWGPGVFNPETCAWEKEELWTAGTNQDGKIVIHLLDGDDGSDKAVITVPTGAGGLNHDFFGIYGAAVDGDGNFWGSQLGSNGRLIRVNHADMSYKIWDTPNGPHWYGMTVDADGMVWLCSGTVGRFDPETETWITAQVGGWTGCMADAQDNGLLWMSNGNGVVGVNRDTLQVEKIWEAAGSYGISIDFEGYIWAVASGSNANKIDPDTGQFWTYPGLVGAYTYSDMTGYALNHVGTPSG